MDRCHFTIDETGMYWNSCNLEFGCRSVGCFAVSGDGYYNDAGGWTGDPAGIEYIDIEPSNGIDVDNILVISDRVGIDEAIKKALEGGYSVDDRRGE